MEGPGAYYAVDVEEAAARLQESPDRIREMLATGELEGIPPGATAQGDWKVLLPATPDLAEPEPTDEPPAESTSLEPEDAPPETQPQEGDQEGEEATEEAAEPADLVAPPAAREASARVSDEIPDEPSSELLGEAQEGVRGDAGESGWTTTKQAAKVLGVSRRSVQGYVRRGLLEAREEGEGVNKTFLVSIASLNALRDRRSREAGEAAKQAAVSAEGERAANLSANTGEALRHAIERVEARTAEATELRVRLEITEKAQSTLRTELEEERRRREAAERERDELRRQLGSRLDEPEEPPPTSPATPERVERRAPPVFSQGSSQPRSSWWRRMFRG
jgi:hypothetical protein